MTKEVSLGRCLTVLRGVDLRLWDGRENLATAISFSEFTSYFIEGILRLL